MAAAGAAAVVGHIYPVWLRFHGGKGVAVAAGVFGVLAPLATVRGAGGVLLDRLAHARHFARLGRRDRDAAVRRARSPGAPTSGRWSPRSASRALILFRHRANIRRIASGTERRDGSAAVSERDRRSRRRQLGHGAGRPLRARSGTTCGCGAATPR